MPAVNKLDYLISRLDLKREILLAEIRHKKRVVEILEAEIAFATEQRETEDKLNWKNFWAETGILP